MVPHLTGTQLWSFSLCAYIYILDLTLITFIALSDASFASYREKKLLNRGFAPEASMTCIVFILRSYVRVSIEVHAFLSVSFKKITKICPLFFLLRALHPAWTFFLQNRMPLLNNWSLAINAIRLESRFNLSTELAHAERACKAKNNTKSTRALKSHCEWPLDDGEESKIQSKLKVGSTGKGYIRSVKVKEPARLPRLTIARDTSLYSRSAYNWLKAFSSVSRRSLTRRVSHDALSRRSHRKCARREHVFAIVRSFHWFFDNYDAPNRLFKRKVKVKDGCIFNTFWISLCPRALTSSSYGLKVC